MNPMNYRAPHAKHQGFTLVETLVAIAIFTIAIVAPFTAASRALAAAAIARDTLVATNLAQEGLEGVRELRTNGYLTDSSDPDPDLDQYLADCISPKICDVNSALTTYACTGSACSALYLNTTTGAYTHTASGSTVSPFSRTISIQKSPNGQSGTERATVTVTWTSHGAHSVILTEDFYDWF
ncbi:MAG TPA: prepilin-type N-terminal cleavage/methylation domain-containing protein [Candidatus Paceibacterota bacterium]